MQVSSEKTVKGKIFSGEEAQNVNMLLSGEIPGEWKGLWNVIFPAEC